MQYGSPTAELFVASYNNRSNKLHTIELGLDQFGYTENTESGWLSTEDNYEIYNKSTLSDWWLASPINGGSSGNEGWLVDGSYGYFDYGWRSDLSYAVRPIVCIPTSVFDSSYTLEDK